MEEQLLARVETGVRNIKDELESIKSSMTEAEAEANIKDKLESIKSSMTEAEADEDQKAGMKTWIRQVRELANDIEDVLDEFNLHIRTSIEEIEEINEIDEIKAQLYDISQRRNMYNLTSVGDVPTSESVRDQLHGHVEAVFVNEAELVGIEEPREDLIMWLTMEDLQLKMISVVGMGGLGKTTLVRKVYRNETVRAWFKCHAWITLTQSFAIADILRVIIIQFFDELVEPLPERIDMMEIIQLIEIISRFLQDKRFVVVLDDVCVEAWMYLKYALPDNNHGSRILVTTTNNDVSDSCLESSAYVYQLHPLPPTKAWSLFCKKAFRTITDQICPPELEDTARDIVGICDGLPLAIVTIGGLLSRNVRLLEWKTLHNNLRSELANNPKLEPIKRILSMSYNDLPHPLKSGILYFSLFPKDHPVKRITLIRLWMAEGFIEAEQGKTMEMIAGDYLRQLIDRSMIQVAEHYDYGRVRSCRVHDLIHEIIVLKSNEENFMSTPLARRGAEKQGKLRRFGVHNTTELKDVSLCHLRAFFMFGLNTLSTNCLRTIFSGFRRLKVLDLEGAPIEQFPVEFGKLNNLRYLSLRGTRINKLPKTLGQLKNLETLDLKSTNVSELPKSILKLQNLRHLLAYYYTAGRHPTFYDINGVNVPCGIGRLKELQKLSYAKADHDTGIIRELGNLTQLKRLGIVQMRSIDDKDLCAAVQKMRDLESLSVSAISKEEILNLESLSDPPPCIQRLYLRGPLNTLPEWIGCLNNLARMRLRWSKLKEGSIAILESLPNLVELTLIRAYDGVRLCCKKDRFQKLRVLDLEELENLNYVIFEGPMLNLRKMYIRGCTQLEAVPLGIEEARLRELHLLDMPEVFFQKLQKNTGPDHLKVQHIPIVRFYDNQY